MFNGKGRFFPISRGAGCEADHSYPFNVAVRNQCSCTSIPSFAFMTCAGTNLPVVVVVGSGGGGSSGKV